MNNNFDTKISVNPVKSQVVLIAVLIIACVSLVTSFSFLALEKYIPAIFPSLVGVSLLWFAIKGWNKSQELIDSGEAKEMQIQTSSDSIEIRGDSKQIIANPEAIQQLVEAFGNIVNRKPLPEPDGLVDNNLQIKDNSQESAKEIIDSVNLENQKITDELLTQMHSSSEVIHQPLLNEQPPPNENADVNCRKKL